VSYKTICSFQDLITQLRLCQNFCGFLTTSLEGGGALQAAEIPGSTVILRSRRRRRISHCIENTQSEIHRFAQDDSKEVFFRSL
jgi:hypothetical protein